MNQTLFERLKNWICSKIGHKSFIDYNSLGGGDPEICKRCNRLLSTAYSRTIKNEQTN